MSQYLDFYSIVAMCTGLLVPGLTGFLGAKFATMFIINVLVAGLFVYFGGVVAALVYLVIAGIFSAVNVIK